MTSLLQVRRTYVGLTALHWIAIGTMAPVLVLTLQARGLSLTVIGVLFTVHSVLIGALELPTGGLADTYGRRRVLLWSSVLMTGAMLLVGLGARLPVLVLGLVLSSVGRALSSGPLEAWFVDASMAADDAADLTPGLGAGSRAAGLGLGAGMLVGGVLPSLAAGLPAGGRGLLSTSVPFLVAAVLFAGEAAALGRFVHPLPRDPGEPTSGVGASVRHGLAVVRRSNVSRRVLAVDVAVGVAAAAFEILVPVRLEELTGSSVVAAAIYGPLSAAGAAAGALLAGVSWRIRDLAGAPARAALWLMVAGGIGGLLAGLPAVAAVAVGSLMVFGMMAPTTPLLNTLLHAEIGRDARTVMVSMVSLATYLGGAVGAVAVPFAAAGLGTGVGLAIGAGAMGIGAVPLVGLRPARGDGDDGEAGRRQPD